MDTMKIPELILALYLASAAIGFCEQVPFVSQREAAAAIKHAKGTMVSNFDGILPKVNLEFFLEYEGGGAPIRWEVNDCGEQTSVPAPDRGRDRSICVVANMDSKNGMNLAVFLAVGTVAKGLSSAPALLSVILTDANGFSRDLHRLGELPKELHRPSPRMPKELPDRDESTGT